MKENTLAKGTMSKTNALPITFCIIGCGLLLFMITKLQNVYVKGDERTAIATLSSVGMLLCFSLAAYFHLLFNNCEITVTDKRVYGKAAFGKRVDLPIDMISAVGVSAFNGVHVATASGKLTFYLCQNRDAVFSAISTLLVERQGKATSIHATTVKQEIPQSNADELKKYKDLLDSGVISQEEFDAKKKQLLGL